MPRQRKPKTFRKIYSARPAPPAEIIRRYKAKARSKSTRPKAAKPKGFRKVYAARPAPPSEIISRYKAAKKGRRPIKALAPSPTPPPIRQPAPPYEIIRAYKAKRKPQKPVKPQKSVKPVDKAELLRQKILSKFKPKKIERYGFIFVGLDGKRTNSNNRKGYWIYVGGELQTEFVKDPRTGKLFPSLKRSFNLSDLRGKKKAKEKLAQSSKMASLEHRIIQTKNELEFGIDLARAAVVISRGLNRFINIVGGESSANYLIELAFIIQLDSGEIRTIIGSFGFGKNFRQPIKAGSLADIITSKLYAVAGEELKRHEFVSSRSKKYMRELNDDIDEDFMDEWINSDGDNWGKSDFNEAQIIQIDYKFYRTA